MHKARIAALGAAGSMAFLCASAEAVLLGAQVREDKTLGPAANLPAGLRTFNIYAKFDGAGELVGEGRRNHVVGVDASTDSTPAGLGVALTHNPGANFFQATTAQGASSSNVGGVNVSVMQERGKYDTFCAIGVKYIDPDGVVGGLPSSDDASAGLNFAMVDTDGVAGPAALGLGAGHDRVLGSWVLTTGAGQGGATLNPSTNEYEVILGQFSIAGLAAGASVWNSFFGDAPSHATTWHNSIFTGQLEIFTLTSDGGVDSHIVAFDIPAPGAAAALGLAGVAGMRRRRA